MAAAVGEARPGYELWHPNREKAEAKTTKAIVAFVLIISAALLLIITLGGWERLQSPGVGLLTIGWAGLYVLFAFLVIGWNRGVLPVASALAMIMIIFAAVAAPGWFDRARDGLSSPLLPEELLGMLTLIVIPVQLLLIIISLVAFNQEWHVEEERPVDGHDDGHPDDRAGDEYEEEPVYADEPGTEPARHDGGYRAGPSAPSTS
jgi:lysylphosphatidylglycerol synthetase-like protein (DUF2156 family)